jgi:hypothetical protein
MAGCRIELVSVCMARVMAEKVRVVQQELE